MLPSSALEVMVHESSDLENYGTGHRTFDCPWCGAISGIDPSHIGEHFDCPECKRPTKLTPANTRARHLTDAPKEAPHHEEGGEEKPAHEVSEWESYGKGHRTFDCPWCGAISGLDPSHLGEHFNCPECHKETKLTAENTRATHVTEPAPDAPAHVEKSRSGLLLVAVLAVVVGVVAVIVATGSGDDESRDAGPEVARTPPADPGPDAPPPVDPAVPTIPEPQPPAAIPDGPPSETPPNGGEPPAPATPQPGDEQPPAEQPDEPPVDPAVPQDPAEAAKLDLERAQQALKDWETAHPDMVEKLGLLKACTDVRSEAARLCESYPGPDATQAEARAYNVVMREFVAADPKRIEAAQRIVVHLNSERLKPRFLESWESVNFYLPHVRDTMGQLEAAGQCVESEEYGALLRSLREAEAALENATAAN